MAAPAARYAGTRVPRVEDARLLTGHGTYVDDIVRPGMLHACFVRSPFAHARINAIDTSAALALPGVHAVFTAADLNPEVKEAWHAVAGKDIPDTPRPPLAEHEVKFVGDPVALVVAENRYVAEDAIELVDVDYDPLPVIADVTKAVNSDVVVHAAYPDNVAGGLAGAPPDEDTFAAAACLVSETHLPADARARTDRDAWPGRRMGLHHRRIDAVGLHPDPARVAGVHRQAARHPGAASARDRPRHRRRVRPEGRADARGHVHHAGRAQGARSAQVDRRPPREPHVGRSGPPRRRHRPDGVRRRRGDHRRRHRLHPGHRRLPDPIPGVDHRRHRDVLPRPLPGAQGQLQLQDGVHQHQRSGAPTAGPGSTKPSRGKYFSTSRARKMGIDPVEVRRKNLLRGDEMPYFNPNGMPYDHVAPMDTFEQAVKILDHEGFRKEQAEALAQGRYIGLGFSAYIEPTGAATGHLATEGATIRMEPTGKINVYVNGGSSGNSIETTVVQLTADALGADIEDVATIQGDTAVTPYGAGTQGSRSGPMTAGAVNEAATILRGQLTAMAAHRLGVDPEQIELAGSRAASVEDPSKSVSFADLAYRAHYEPQQLPPGMSATLEATARFTSQTPIHWANATHACTCEVDTITGRVTLTRYIVSEDVGPMINPNIVEGQIAGGTVQGIGGALLENLVYDDDGNPLSTTFVDYLLPTATEVPTIEYGHVEVPSPGVGGYKGCGEGGAIGATPAVINAINDALAPLGVTITKLPATPASIVAMIDEASRG